MKPFPQGIKGYKPKNLRPSFHGRQRYYYACFTGLEYAPRPFLKQFEKEAMDSWGRSELPSNFVFPCFPEHWEENTPRDVITRQVKEAAIKALPWAILSYLKDQENLGWRYEAPCERVPDPDQPGTTRINGTQPIFDVTGWKTLRFKKR